MVKYHNGEMYIIPQELIDEIRADVVDELKSKKDEIIKWLIKRDLEGYGTTNGELLDHIIDIAEQLKESR